MLTAHARQNSLGYGAEYTGSGRQAESRAPRTCRQAIGDQIDFARTSSAGLERLGSDEPDISFIKVDDRTAQVRVEPPGVDIYLVKTSDGWRADRTDDFPFDGSTGL